MDGLFWLALVSIALGTFSMRLLPLLLMKSHLNKQGDQAAAETIPQWLRVMGPLMIAGMLGVLMVPSEASLQAWVATLIGSIATYGAWLYTRSFGLPVFVGVIVFGLAVIGLRVV